MNDLIPPFDFSRVFVEPWTIGRTGFISISLMGFFVALACGWVGQFLILRRMALVGDAISHSILPGLAGAFLLSGTRSATAMFIGALVAGLATSAIIEVIHRKTRVKQDAAIGIAFTSLFALGVLLINLYAGKVDLDQECVLYGEIAFIAFEPPAMLGGWNLGPQPIVQMGIVTVITGVILLLFYKELLVSSFDSGLAFSLGIHPSVVHYALMAWLSMVVVSAFESVGAILVVAMLILPGATASMLTTRLPVILALVVINAALSSVLGYHFAMWLDCSVAGAMVVCGGILFAVAWLCSPHDGLPAYFHRRTLGVDVPADGEAGQS